MNKKSIMESHEEKTSVEKPKICFIIMPIADINGYDNGHFLRVYNHLIKPACELAGFTPVRADDVSSSHMIVVDILKKIVESDLAICDLSARNPNVLYELGLRQAFNKKTVLIKDNKTENIFDVQGFRYAGYDSGLRIDNVKNEVTKLANALKETYNATDDINSIVQLLKIEPAKIEQKTELSEGDTILFRAINELTKKVEYLSINSQVNNYIHQPPYHNEPHSWIGNDKEISIISSDGLQFDMKLGEQFYFGQDYFGSLHEIDYKGDSLVFQKAKNRYVRYEISDPILTSLSKSPTTPN